MGQSEHSRERTSRTQRMLRRAGRALGGVRLLAALLLLAVGVLRLEDPAFFKTLRFESFDRLQQAAPRPYGTDKIAIIDIDEESLKSLGQWP